MRERIYMKLHSVMVCMLFAQSISKIVQDRTPSSLLRDILYSISSKMFTKMILQRNPDHWGKKLQGEC